MIRPVQSFPMQLVIQTTLALLWVFLQTTYKKSTSQFSPVSPRVLHIKTLKSLFFGLEPQRPLTHPSNDYSSRCPNSQHLGWVPLQRKLACFIYLETIYIHTVCSYTLARPIGRNWDLWHKESQGLLAWKCASSERAVSPLSRSMKSKWNTPVNY